MLALLRAAYPSFYRDLPVEDLRTVVNLWQVQFAGDDGEAVLAAVHALIAVRTEGYPPTIGAVKEQMAKLAPGRPLTEAEAWALVSRAARNGAYGYRQEFEKLPPAVQRAVGSAEQLRVWAGMEEDKVASIVAPGFQRAYRAEACREREQALLPLRNTALPLKE